MRAKQFTPEAIEKNKRNRYIRRLHQMTGWDTSHLELLSNDELRDLHIQHQHQRNDDSSDSTDVSTDEAMSASLRMQRALQRAKEKREREERAGEKLLNPPKPKPQGVAEAEGEEDYYYRVRHQTEKDIELEMPPKAWDAVGPKYATYEEAKEAFEQLKAKHPNERFTYTRHPRISHMGGKAQQVFPEDQEQFCSECGGSLAEHGKASRALCISRVPDEDLGASQLASCKSQGLRARDGNKSHKLGKSAKSRIKVGGHKIKGNKYGGPLPDWS
jgi:hypothetical protein